MDPERALAVISTICANHRGTLEEHSTIQMAMDTLRQIVNKFVAPEPEPEIDATKETER